MIRSEIIPETTIWDALERRIKPAERTPVLTVAGADWTARQLRDGAEVLAGRLAARGIDARSRVLVFLPNCLDHVLLILSLARLGAVWAAASPDQRGPALDHIVRITRPTLIIASPEAADALSNLGVSCSSLIACRPGADDLAGLVGKNSLRTQPHRADPDHLRAIVFTSGTTGPPKAVQVTERMLVAAAWGAAAACDAEAGDRFLLWEPLYHIGGSQMLVLSLLLPIRLFLVPRFSASQFWRQISTHGITKLHYLGGVLEILLRQPPSRQDGAHGIVLAFGAGARPEVWRAFQDRFDIPLREVYGLTEASSFTAINRGGLVGSIGKPLPWADVTLVDEQGEAVSDGEVGEILIRPSVPGLLTPGYLDDDAATAELVRDGSLYTGDLAKSDGQGGLCFVGRKRDAIRCRGELVSAWEVEAALLAHPDVADCAAIAVPAEIGEEEILVFVRGEESRQIDPAILARWAGETLPRRCRPRYWRIVADFPRTPSARIAKAELPRDIRDAYDAGNAQ